MHYKSPLRYFNSAAASDGGSLLVDLVDARDQPVSLLLDRSIDSHNVNEIFINHQQILYGDDVEFWLTELTQIFHEAQFDYEGEKHLIAEFIKILEQK